VITCAPVANVSNIAIRTVAGVRLKTGNYPAISRINVYFSAINIIIDIIIRHLFAFACSSYFLRSLFEISSDYPSVLRFASFCFECETAAYRHRVTCQQAHFLVLQARHISLT
jgi:hypothetical protein